MREPKCTFQQKQREYYYFVSQGHAVIKSLNIIMSDNKVIRLHCIVQFKPAADLPEFLLNSNLSLN